MSTSSKPAVREATWALEVVRGREVGRVYELEPGETLLGNALDGHPGLDLKDQEGDSPRRMAGRQAAIVVSSKELSIRDLESPGGTFVNRQRLLAGQTRKLAAGDLIQLGSVQLAVKPVEASSSGSSRQAPAATAPARSPRHASSTSPASSAPPVASPPPGIVGQGTAPPPSSARPVPGGRLATPFSLPGGRTCRTWDDFLVLAAQEWQALRDELTSGRLSDYLRQAQRVDLLPRLDRSRSTDEQLDEWLGRLPTSKTSAPELDVHPPTLNVRAAGGGGRTRHTLRVTNIGYRLLRSTIRIDPVSASWLRVSVESGDGPFTTVDETDLAVEIDLPETLAPPLEASIVIESNGGTRRVPVRIEKAQAPMMPADSAGFSVSDSSLIAQTLHEKLAEIRPAARILWGAGGAIAVRLLVFLAGGLLYRTNDARLSAVAVALVGACALLASFLALRRGAAPLQHVVPGLPRAEERDVAAAAFTGAALGLMAAAICFALIQTVERVLGSYAASFWTVALVWGLIGALAALLSSYLVPYRPGGSEVGG
jgi:hypothetical protein